jgi:DNA-binding CsgD family transcriptional regulator
VSWSLLSAIRAFAGVHAPTLPEVYLTPRWSRLLTPKEMQIVELVVTGKSNLEVAKELGNTEQCIKNYLNRIYAELDIKSRVQLVLFYYAKPISEYRAALGLPVAAGPAVHHILVDTRGNSRVECMQLRKLLPDWIHLY